jgi:hypothetical protein
VIQGSATPTTAQNKNPWLEEIEKRAIAAIHERRKNVVGSSLSIVTNIWTNEIKSEVAAQMVKDVENELRKRADFCSVCYMVCGIEDRSHEPGSRCPRLPLGEDNEGWKSFKTNLKFKPGICYACALPTVRGSLDRLHHVADTGFDAEGTYIP